MALDPLKAIDVYIDRSNEEVQMMEREFDRKIEMLYVPGKELSLSLKNSDRDIGRQLVRVYQTEGWNARLESTEWGNYLVIKDRPFRFYDVYPMVSALGVLVTLLSVVWSGFRLYNGVWWH